MQEELVWATGERIRELRWAHRWTQAELARRLGHGRTAVVVSNYETGRSHVDSDELPVWAKALEVPPTAFHEPAEVFIEICLNIRRHRLAGADNLSIQLDLFRVIRPYSPTATHDFALAASA